MPRLFLGVLLVLAAPLFLGGVEVWAEEDRVGRAAIEAIRSHMRVPQEMAIIFVEKKESPIPDFFAVKVVIVTADKEVPKVLYIDKTLEKVIFGDLFVKGENTTRAMAGESKPRRIETAKLEPDRSPARGPAEAGVTLVNFSNFQCPFCMRSWGNIQKAMEKNPGKIRYVFKHLPLQTQGKSFDLSEMAAAAQESGAEAFWALHDFLYTQEGQNAVKGEKETIRQKFAEILKEKGFDAEAFLGALDKGKGRKRLEEDMALARQNQISRAPTILINGLVHTGLLTEKTLEGFLEK